MACKVKSIGGAPADPAPHRRRPCANALLTTVRHLRIMLGQRAGIAVHLTGRPWDMLSRIAGATAAVGLLFMIAGCTAQDGKVWLDHNTHFASGEHALFSMKNNKDGSNPKVTRLDIEDSRTQNWWGIYAVTVDQKQILQN
jgi:hypothetical protein